MDEKRSYQRYPVEMNVKLRKPDRTSAEIDAKVIDVSSGGMGIIVGEELQPGTEVFIEWTNPPFYVDGETIERGTVVGGRSEKEDGLFRMSVKFSDPDSQLVQSLLNWVQMEATRQKRAHFGANQYSGHRKINW